MNEVIRQIVQRIWVNHIGIPSEWTQEQAETFFRTEADRLSEMIGQLQIETQHAVIREWRVAHSGAEPDYLTQVGLISSACARAQAEEIVLSQELYEQVPAPQRPEETGHRAMRHDCERQLETDLVRRAHRTSDEQTVNSTILG